MRILVLFIVGLFTTSSFAQNLTPYKFKKISADLINQEEHPLFPDAVAAFEHNRCQISYSYDYNVGFLCETKISHRIKIYKEEGKEYGNYEMRLYRKNTTEKEYIKDLIAFTYNKQGDKIKGTKLSKSSIFETTINDNYTSFSFAMPDVQEGSVLEITYTFVTPYYFHLDDFYFQKEIPVNNMAYYANFPEYFSYNPIVKGAIKIDESKTQGSGQLSINNGSDRINFQSDDYAFLAVDIPPIKEEPYVHNMRNYMAAISWELRSTNFPNSFVKNYNTTWSQVAETLNESNSFGNFLNANHKEISKVIDRVQSMDDSNKINEIYSFVRSFTWNDKYSVFGGNMNKLMKSRTGNSGQLNLLLINMLKKAGINVFPVVLKTRDRGYLNVSYPTLGELNYVIAGIPTEKDMIFLDATVNAMPAGFLPYRALNLNGVIINGNEAVKIDIKSPNKEKNTHYIKASFNEQMELKGTQTSKYSKFSGFTERVEVSSADSEEAYFKTIEEKSDQINCSNFNIENMSAYNKPLEVTADIDFTGLTQKIDDKIFIPTLMQLGISENPYRAEERNFNLNYNTVNSTKVIINYPIPEGYEVESLPEPISLTLPDKSFTYRFNVTSMNNTINITSFIDRKADNIEYEMYASLREIYEEILKKSNEKIVLAKK